MGEAITKYPEKRIYDGIVDLMIDLLVHRIFLWDWYRRHSELQKSNLTLIFSIAFSIY